jgi:geranylgeranyl diphosphate synthase type II
MSERMERYREMVENALPYALPQPEGCAKVLCEAMRYSLLAGGKRLRPCLTLAAAESVGADLTEALPYACAMEMVHTYSLIHDDLPAMDNDTLRRWRPTNHVVYGEAMAILAGDGLLSHAFAHINRCALEHPEHARAHLRAMKAVTDAAGAEGMVAGQSVDVYCEKHGCGEEDKKKLLDYIHRNKTAAMIRGALLAGAELGNPSDAVRAAFSEYGEKLGIAFQVADDILDACSTSESMGKTVGKDAQEGKLTYVSLYGVEESKKRLAELTEAAKHAIEPVDADGFFRDLAQQMLIRTH